MKYYLHSVDTMDDEKVIELFKAFGYEGTGLFHAILEKLAKQEKPMRTDLLKYHLKVGKRLEKCWSFMEQIGLISSNNGDTFNKQLLNYAQSYQIKKEKTAKKISEWRKNQDNKENVTGYEPSCNPPKVKESKVKESKVKESKVKEERITVEKSTVYQDFIFLYDQFIKKQTGAPCKINGAEGKAAKEIISYLRSAVKQNDPEAGDQKILSSWEIILNSVNRWDAFYRDKLKLSQINSNLINIVNNIRNGKPGKQPATSHEQIDRIVDAVYGIK